MCDVIDPGTSSDVCVVILASARTILSDMGGNDTARILKNNSRLLQSRGARQKTIEGRSQDLAARFCAEFMDHYSCHHHINTHIF
jgi:hypothetical protein